MTLPDVFLTTPIAHRALHDKSQGRPENSRAAVRAAVESGYGIEIDLQPSSDGVPMVFHDYDLGRLTASKGPIALQTAATLAATPLLYGSEGIPTLAEVFEIIGGRVPLLIEIKDQDGAMGPNVGALEKATVAVLRGYEGPVAVMSFNPHTVRIMGELAPDIPRGLTTSAYEYDDWVPLPEDMCDQLRAIPDYETSGASFISHESFDLHRKRVAELKAKGAAVLCWTIRSPEEEAEARRVAQNVTFEGYLA
ncbi:MAG: glycerophosphodiester phosphodiesterase family protein [Rhodobacterales bacterium]|nr:glycerophosphodiester phosphodiesterase family protein [Rhodobacterales bacterium]